MQDITIKIRNSYGIRRLEHTFRFNTTANKHHNSIIPVYAQNGTMKSSFANTIYSYSKDIGIKDFIFDEIGVCSVEVDGTDIAKDNILAISSFDTSPFESKNMSSLVASEDIKNQYDELTAKYHAGWDELISKIKKVAKPNNRWKEKDILKSIISTYGTSIPVEPDSLLHLLTEPSGRKQIEESPDYIQDIPHTRLESAQVDSFIKRNAGTIKRLIDVYDEVRKSPTFYKNGFDATNARKFADTAKNSKYFAAEHSMKLINSSTGMPYDVKNEEDLESALTTDIDLVLSKHPALKKPFTKLIEDFGKDNHSDLRKILEDDKTKDIVLLMDNPISFKRRVWQGYLKACLPEADDLINLKKSIEDDLKALIQRAKDEQTEWDDIKDQFNDRFHNLPYTVEITNKESLIFKDTTIPVMALRYQHPVDERKTKLVEPDQNGKYQELQYLSTGERKAFYLLNILFELEVRQKSNSKHLIILDDIVDSFDYKNKYAFLEYINDIASKYNNLRIIFLTHNFDFFRLLKSRLNSDDNNFFIATKKHGDITLATADCFEIFRHMRMNAHNDKKIWLATIPFVRNIIEFKTEDRKDPASPFMTLTNCLHSLDNDQKISTIKAIIQTELSNITTAPFNDGDEVNEVLIEVAKSIFDDGQFNLYENIVLAMACRRIAEDYMKIKINDRQLVENAKRKVPFTRGLYTIYKNSARDIKKNKEIISTINLITPEHIHLNAFAYEPLIDIDKQRLIKLRDDMIKLHDEATRS